MGVAYFVVAEHCRAINADFEKWGNSRLGYSLSGVSFSSNGFYCR